MENQNKLIKYNKENILHKIFNFLKGFFKKEQEHAQTNNINTDESFNDRLHVELKKGNEKNMFFKYYDDYKNNKIKSNDIPLAILIRINKMLEEEIKIKVNAYSDLENAIIENDLLVNSRKTQQ